jgi:hypothetical protein
MGQGFQRALGPEGQVLPLPQPSPQLLVSPPSLLGRCKAASLLLCIAVVRLDCHSKGQQQWQQHVTDRPKLSLQLAHRHTQRPQKPCGHKLPASLVHCCVLLLQGGLGKQVQLFLSDVETDTWSQEDLQQVVLSAAQVVITQGEKGATLLAQVSSSSRSDSKSSSTSRSSDGSTATSSSSSLRQLNIPAVKVRVTTPLQGNAAQAAVPVGSAVAVWHLDCLVSPLSQSS